ncbi:hypothetical protein [Flavimaricola marinus]|uniref:Uncharacterized protein n=1 Tax=Flavimaricola marinus TaxID=1819565 RepID=A0A238LG06_9RHOB|nr:hypothetical protein [Flavimaricola marinus]SMY08512.1 hypothetical protein LOM8899_02665 [Flavimaricola marinus]
MSHTERNTLVSILTSLLINSYVIIRLINMYGSGALDGPDATQVWARMILWTIAAGIVLTVVLIILANILIAIVERGENTGFIVDERDKVFEIRGNSVTMLFAAIGFVGSIVALAMGFEALTVFVMIYFSFALGSLAGDLVKIASYRAGV